MTTQTNTTAPRPVLDFHVGDEHIRVYLLNVGEHFPRFGGSSAGLVVRKTASLIVSTTSFGHRRDTEFNLADPEAWAAIERALRKAGPLPAAEEVKP